MLGHIPGATAATVVLLAAGTASAQRNAIDIRVRYAGVSDWHDQLVLLSSQDNHIEVGVFYERAGGFGFAGAVHNVVADFWSFADSVVLLDRPDSAQHPDGRQGRFNFGAQRQAAYATGADTGTLRIAAANNTQNAAGGGISVRQNTPGASGSLFDTGNPVLGFRFDLHINPANSGNFVWNLSTPLDRLVNFAIYETGTSTSGTNVLPPTVVLDGAQLVVPAPGSLACGTAIAALMLRKRRQ